MTGEAELAAGEVVLRRARDGDLDAVVALQRAAYAVNRPLLCVEPLPLLADYADILRDMEVWVAEADGETLTGALILQPLSDHLLLWSIATDPAAQRSGLGRELLGAAEVRARQLGLPTVRLYTGTPLTHLVGWYGRHGYQVERIEALSDRSITHMIKHVSNQATPAPITKDEATRIALAHIERLQRKGAIELMLMVSDTIERSFGWVFFYQSKRYLQSGCVSDLLAGNAPIVVARADGRIHVTGTARPLEYYLKELAAAEGWKTQE